MFMDAIKETLNEDMNYSVTENGALGYHTTGKALLDLNFAVASLRSASEQEIINKFMKAFCEDKILAMRWLFFGRDREKGLGERRLFRVVVSDLAKSNPEMILPVIKLFSEYGRWDDMWCLLDIPAAAEVVYDIVDKQLTEDLKNMNEGKPISLLGKWMPSINTSSNQTKKYAKQICFYLVCTAEKQFGSGTGTLKYAAVTAWLYERLPLICKLFFTEKQIDNLIETSVQKMKEWLSNNDKAVEALIEKEND